jgi:drug/metabolite transporter (DMT)-like permease
MIALVFGMYMLFATTFTLAKAVLVYINPIRFIAIRMIIAGILLLVCYRTANQRRIVINRRDRGLFLQGILFTVFCAYVFEFWALQYMDSGKASIFFNLSPFITAIISHSIWREKLTRNQWTGMAIGFLGFIPLVCTMPQQEHFIGGGWGALSLPELMMFVSVCSFAYGWIIVKELVVVRGYSALVVNGISMIGGGLLATFTSLLLEGIPSLSTLTGTVGSSLITIAGFMGALILIANVICYNLYAYLLREYTATFLSFAGFSTPLFAITFGYAFLGEKVTWEIPLCMVFVVTGLYIFYRDELNKKSV